MPVDVAVRSKIITNNIKGWITISSDANQDPKFFPVYRNIVQDKENLPTSRNGSSHINTSALDGKILTIMEWFPQSTSSSKIKLVLTNNGSIYKLNTDNTFTSLLTGLTADTRIEPNGWANFKGTLYFCNGVDAAKKFDGSTIRNHISSGGFPIQKYNYIHVHNQRLFTAGGTISNGKFQYSTLNDPDDWSTGELASDAGAIDTSQYVKSPDIIQGINSHEDFLVIFARNNITVWNFGTDQTAFTLGKVVDGIGLDVPSGHVQIGNDIFFWSKFGIKSLASSINTNTLQIGKEISFPIANELLTRLNTAITNGNDNRINMVSYPKKGWLILSYPVKSDSSQYRQAVYNTVFKVWSEFTGWNFPSMYVDAGGDMFGGDNNGFLSTLDDDGSVTDNGVNISYEIETAWLYLGSFSREKILDAMKIIINSDKSLTMDVKNYYDYLQEKDTESDNTFDFSGGGLFFEESGNVPSIRFGGLMVGTGLSSGFPFALFGSGLVHKFNFRVNDAKSLFSVPYIRLDYTVGGRT